MTRRPGSGVQAHRRRNADVERTVDAAVAEVKAARDAEWEARKTAARQAHAKDEANKPSLDQIRAAKYVRTRYGWHKIARINAKTVSVETGHSWTDRIALDSILEARP